MLKITVGLVGLIYGTVLSLFKREWHKYYMSLVISIDQYGNCVCQYLFNHTLIKKSGYKFGNIDETISSVLGKNKRDETLTIIGKMLSNVLNFLDKNHVENSIDETIIVEVNNG